jgi:class 3 adenylate cyclase
MKKENAEKEKPIISPREYDNLENDLVNLETQTDILRRISYWITKQLDCNYVLFYADQGKSMRDRVKYYGEQVHSLSEIGTVVEERTAKTNAEEGLFVHTSGALSIPISYSNFLHGFIFIGPNKDGKQYSPQQKKMLGPVERIINHALLAFDAMTSRQEKNRLRYAFSRYVSPEVVNNIMVSPEAIHPGGKKQVLTVIFTDLQNFTQLSESMEPTKLLLVLNMYLNEMSQVILSLGGTIDKYEGDAIMAFFGAPKPFPDHAVRCCLAALRMKRMQDVLNEQLIHEKLVERPLFTRMGINTGEMIVGNVGSMQRLDYTVIGNNVNIAARIETSNKEYNTALLISESTYLLVQNYFKCRKVADARLKGVSEPVPVYELLDVIQETIPEYTNFSESQNDDAIEDAETADEEGLEEL